jgi:hypothetical protein
MQVSGTNHDPGRRSTGFDAAEDESVGADLRPFGVIFCVLWMALLAFIFLTRRRQDALRLQVRDIEKMLDKKL